jgi:spore germination protein GerM
MTVKVYFGTSLTEAKNSDDCSNVAPFKRVIPKTKAVARAALEELLKGPNQEEKNGGYVTSLNPGLVIQRLTIDDGVAQVDFNEELRTSCWRFLQSNCNTLASRRNTLAIFNH